jgi:hypothetical protein
MTTPRFDTPRENPSDRPIAGFQRKTGDFRHDRVAGLNDFGPRETGLVRTLKWGF